MIITWWGIIGWVSFLLFVGAMIGVVAIALTASARCGDCKRRQEILEDNLRLEIKNLKRKESLDKPKVAPAETEPE